jgi:vitamin K epoxide reductase family protein
VRWRGFLISALGLWLIATPLTFPTTSRPLFFSEIICGVVALIIGLLAVHFPLLAWVGAGIGLWLELAPLIFWAPEAATYINDTFIGMLFLLFSFVIPDTPGAPQSDGAEVPPGWSYNPSSYLQRIPVIALNIVCWLIARYLAAYQLGYITEVWDPFFTPGTVAVLTSKVSQSFPVSDAGLGATAYLLEALFGFGDTRRWHTMPWFVLFFGILAVPVSCVSIVLILLQPTVVGAWCTLCLVTAFLMLFIVPLAIDEVLATLQFMKKARQEGHPLWRTFWGMPLVVPGPPDPRVPPYNAPYRKLFEAMRFGVSMPWNLALAIAVGLLAIWQNNPVLGALITVSAVISSAEVIRFLRYVITALGVILCMHHLALGILAILLSLRKGPIKERYGAYVP